MNGNLRAKQTDMNFILCLPHIVFLRHSTSNYPLTQNEMNFSNIKLKKKITLIAGPVYFQMVITLLNSRIVLKVMNFLHLL